MRRLIDRASLYNDFEKEGRDQLNELQVHKLRVKTFLSAAGV